MPTSSLARLVACPSILIRRQDVDGAPQRRQPVFARGTDRDDGQMEASGADALEPCPAALGRAVNRDAIEQLVGNRGRGPRAVTRCPGRLHGLDYSAVANDAEVAGVAGEGQVE